MNSLKKFFSNKNTITILGVILCIIILYIGYNYRIKKQTELVKIPYAKQTIGPKTLITEDMVEYMNVPSSFLKGEYYTDINSVLDKYSNYGITIPEGSIFYKELIVDKKDLPDSMFSEIPKGYIVTQFDVDLSTTYANSIMPGNIVNIYFRALDDNGKAVFGKFMKKAKVLSVKDEAGNDVFSASEEVGSPAYMFIALPEELFNLVGKAKKITTNDMEFLVVPNNIKLKDDKSVEISSEDIKEMIEDKSVMIDSNEVIEEEVEEEKIEENENLED